MYHNSQPLAKMMYDLIFNVDITVDFKVQLGLSIVNMAKEKFTIQEFP